MDNYNLNELVTKAKQNLNTQDDPYADLRGLENEDENGNLSSDKKETEGYKIRNTPTENDRNEDYVLKDTVIEEYDEPIFPDGPLTSEVQSWKKHWDGYDIYAIEVCGQYFVFRTLNRFEYKQIIALPNLDALKREEIICETVTIWPESYKWDLMAVGKAGIPSTYSQIIMEKSGFTRDYSIQVI